MPNGLNNLESYRIFLYTARTGNFTKAAQILHITQPSVSYAIKQLEDSLGAKLFDRGSKGVKLTIAGKALFDYIEQSFQLIERGERKLLELANLHGGELRIGASGPIIKHILLPHIEHFHAEHPQVRIRLQQSKTNEISKQLKEENIDLGFVHLPFDDQELAIKPLMAIQDCFLVGQAFKELASEPVSVRQLLELPLLLPTSGSSTRLFVEQWLAGHGIYKEPDIELTSTEMIIEFAQRGYGTAFITRRFAQQELDDGTLFEVRLTESLPTRAIGVVTRKDATLPASSSIFLKEVTNQ
ncbi:DNA-binding transcriptional regulator, LysR family [Paenibacillus catalpae]|uniref:DNA-binding transcriptional regulator, LysR family n=1 Tax=Paenibacillus catalpae TaxID=1045775 RepID=A0A1I2C196_9BACL|nr:LysR family transcriptional regulator [Paenibacillus catalpae]SFE62099.1 DNA-binding transcriptional regulator, LysR family [Paenibacillus catalpae]